MYKFTVKFLITLTLLLLLINHSDITALKNALGRVEWVYVASAALILFVTTPLLGLRWLYIANAIGVPLAIRPAIKIVVIGTFFNQVLPSAIGGDAIRIWMLKKENIPLTKCLSSILLDRVIALSGMVIIVISGFSVLKEIIQSPTMQSAIVAVVGAGIGGVVALLFFDKIPMPRKLSSQLYIAKLLTLAIDARSVFFSPSALIKTVLLSVLIHLMVSFSVWVLAFGMNVKVDLEVFILLLPFVLLLSLLPISVAGWGVREGAMIVCLGYVGVDSASAFVISALFGVAYVFAGIPGGIFWLMEGRLARVG